MYRMNPYNRSTPRDQLDPRMMDRMSMQHHSNNQGCGCGERSRESTSCPMCGENRPMYGEDRSMRNEQPIRYRTRNTENAENNMEHGSCGCSERSNDMRSREHSSCPMCNRMRSEENEKRDECRCDNDDTVNADFNYSLAMVYSPQQEWQNLYCEEEGMMAGTIFKELDKPFYGPKCHGGNSNE